MNPAALRVVLKPRRARPFFARHPWVLAPSIERVERVGVELPAPPASIPEADRADVPPSSVSGAEADVEGAEADLFSHEGAWIARGLYNPHSAIRLRLYRWTPGALDEAFWRRRIDAAIGLRERVFPSVGAVRLIHGESDGLSGLVVDRYGDWLVAQINSLALARRLEVVLGLLRERTGLSNVVIRVDRDIARKERLNLAEGPVDTPAPEGPIPVELDGLIFEVDLVGGQKTGLYLDQRANRMAVAGYARDRRMLDLFCHGGGFALYALRHGGARHALGIDSSETAIESARANAIRNHLPHARFERADVAQALRAMAERGTRYDLVVCDPPKYAKTAEGLENAARAYVRLNQAAVSVLEPGGVLATCSCSGLVTREMFLEILARVATLTRRSIRILEQRGQSADHPVSASCLETDYLKCLICVVEGESEA